MPILTLSSQLGTYGPQIAQRLASRLGCEVLDFQGLTEREIKPRVSEDTWHKLQESPKFYDNLHLGDQTIREYLTQRLIEIATTEGIVYHDFGGPFFFPPDIGARHFRVEAPDDLRLRRIAKENHLPTETAEAWRVQDDRRAQRFATIFFHEDISRPEHYHAVYNNAHLSIGGITDSMLALMRDQAIWEHLDDENSRENETASPHQE